MNLKFILLQRNPQLILMVGVSPKYKLVSCVGAMNPIKSDTEVQEDFIEDRMD